VAANTSAIRHSEHLAAKTSSHRPHRGNGYDNSLAASFISLYRSAPMHSRAGGAWMALVTIPGYIDRLDHPRLHGEISDDQT
jgi:hypothetical protein